ncbi:bifunctional P-450/NADPH-P450 reductase [Rickenella mellea]|uniref:Bifunctional P-450/NADPH-P450 reductase n=1 Tax=Rickenella mellea TaxID=50990 RepID=A0A4Y7QGZ0_9AGAM|nr:bifunctional P-450/NADPH-P450 reductase [Rickenella mellea]
MTTEIPQPPTFPLMGNVLDLSPDLSPITCVEGEGQIHAFDRLALQYGEIYKLDLIASELINCNSHALVAELSNDKRFRKVVIGALAQVRNLVGDGLFTAHHEEPNWATANQILMPAFAAGTIQGMFDDMSDIVSQLLLKWAHGGPVKTFEPTEDYTRLAFDTIALCAMSYRLNSFDKEEIPPFVSAMSEFLTESGMRSARPEFLRPWYEESNAKYEANIKVMSDFARKLIDARKLNPQKSGNKKDLLDLMLEGRDSKTGVGLSDENIIYNLLTFLIAGHETTSGMLSFTTYYLLKNADALYRLREEIDSVCGTEPVSLKHLAKMPYLKAVMRESLRLSPTAPARVVTPLKDEVIGGGKYAVQKDAKIVVHTTSMQRDPVVWGEDANLFKPERMLDEAFAKLPAHAWQPFGFGLRACIGRPFAWQEAGLVLASVFQKFDLFLAEPGYTLETKETLTIKPRDFKIRAALRPGRSIVVPQVGTRKADKVERKDTIMPKGSQPLHVFYGSNTGTCESFAKRLVSAGTNLGFTAHLGTLDSTTAHLPTNGPVVIVTASYEGEPANNATQFVEWLKNLSTSEDQLKGVTYTVFGCGNKDWVNTYQKIPRLCDDLLAARGAERLLPRGETDVSSPAFTQDFQEYEAKLWDALGNRFSTQRPASGVAGEFNVQFVTPGPESPAGLSEEDFEKERARLLNVPDGGVATVVQTRLLTKPKTDEKRYIEFILPPGMTYRAGDYLVVLPKNPPASVKRAMSRLSLRPEQEIVISPGSSAPYPQNKISVEQLLGSYVELSQPITTGHLHTLSDFTTVAATKAAIAELIVKYEVEVIAKWRSALDVLEEYPDINLPLTKFLQMLLPMRARHYSISSSPLFDAQRVALTFSVLNKKALAGKHDRFLGVASNYLANLRPGDEAQVVVRLSNSIFHLPLDPLVPVVMFCAGSGIAPFRGFIQERFAQKESGRDVGNMVLFFGCRNPFVDFLYYDAELKVWQERGVVDVRPAFSDSPDASKSKVGHVQDRVKADKQVIIDAYKAGAKFYTCGSSNVAAGIRDVCIGFIKDEMKCSTEDAAAAFDNVQNERYAKDVYGP